MRTILLLFVLSLAAQGSEYSRHIRFVVEQLRQIEDLDRKLPFIGGAAVGYAGEPGTFFLLYPFFEHRASLEDIRAMLADKSPAVRLMGAKLVLHSDRFGDLTKQVDLLLKDESIVILAEWGCVIERVSVAEVVRRMKADVNFLGDNPKDKEPISVSPPPFEPKK
ncbi:MAG: hypothetical protein KF715_16640 [Candidatus Didemnitutus sp.]|nr:hypothetical protein [Candidatus Didemnitutus sp.]